MHTATLVRRYRGAYDDHEHSHAQVLVGLAGQLQLEVDGHAAFVDASCGLVLPAGCRHAYFTPTTARVLVLDCAPGRHTERFRRFGADPGWTRGATVLSPETLLAALDAAPTRHARRRLDLETLARSVDAKLADNWTIATLASACHLSPTQFRARFAELTGASPLAWLRARRLDRAERLLRQGWLLDAVALQVGYASASALSYALRRDRAVGTRDLRRPARPGPASLET